MNLPNLNTITRALDLLRKGNRVQQAAAWKNTALVGDLIVAAFALATALTGHQWDITQEAANHAAGVIIAAWLAMHGVITTITTRKIGLPAKKPELDLYEDIRPIDMDTDIPIFTPHPRGDLPDLRRPITAKNGEPHV